MDELKDVVIREAEERDAAGIRDVFHEVYGDHYAYPQFYDLAFLKRLILGEDTINLVAEHTSADRLVGTASVVLEVGAMADLLGEFGRLAVVPNARGKGIGRQLMTERVRRVRNRLHVGVVEARVTHHHSLTIAQRHGFVPVGFLPLKNLFIERENIGMLAQWFNDALTLRRNHPRILPEVDPIANAVLQAAGIDAHPIIDDSAPPYPHDANFDIDELSTTGYASLLRIERGRTRHREIFGPMRLQYGFFKLTASHAEYLIARRHGRIAGAVGFIHDDHEKILRIFELIAPDDQAIWYLLSEVERYCREVWGTAYIDVDVSAHAPRMQRTLLELGFVPVAYIPSMVFHEVERLDIVRMAKIFVPLELGPIDLTPEMRAMADLVIEAMTPLEMLPRIGAAVRRSPLLNGLTEEQLARIAAIFTLRTFNPRDRLMSEGAAGDAVYLLLEGCVDIETNDAPRPIGRVNTGEALGEMGLLTRACHTATAVAQTPVVAARAIYDDIDALLRRRPDIGLVLYRNLARGLSEKLRRMDRAHQGA